MNLKQPYYAVIFTSIRTPELQEEYSKMAEQMETLAKLEPGFIGIESAREEVGITVSYWKDKESIKKWKENCDHKVAQELGIKNWYSYYKVRIALVEHEYEFNK